MTTPVEIDAADLFCGAGGFDEALVRVLEDMGVKVRLVCVNHWPVAIETNKKNHPDAIHFCQDIATVRPYLAVPRRRLDILLASPTCTFHSVARGGRPTSDQQRMDPWHINTWLTELKVDRLLVENVPEFVNWGPVDPATGKPIKARKGEYFAAWLDSLRRLGFVVEWRILTAADYGDATTRRRFFMQGRSDGKPITWPAATHARRQAASVVALPRPTRTWRPAREIIDWSIKGRSIFTRKHPLAPKTLLRIYAGVVKFHWPEPYIVVLRNHMAARSIDLPLPTIAAEGTHIGLATPFVCGNRTNNTPKAVDQPIGAATTTTGGGFFVVEPFISGCGGRAAQSAPTGVEEPLGTITTKNDRILVEPFMLSRHAEGAPRSVDEPTPTQVAKHSHLLVEPAPLIAPYYGGGSGLTCGSVDDPLPTATAKARFGMVMPVTHSSDTSARMRDIDTDPLPTVTGANRGELAFIAAAFGERPTQAPRVHSIDDPAPTICATGRINLAPASPEGYDILFRMLEWHELAAAMSFSEGSRVYQFTGTKTEIVKQIGNAVPVRTGKKLIREMLADLVPATTESEAA